MEQIPIARANRIESCCRAQSFGSEVGACGPIGAPQIRAATREKGRPIELDALSRQEGRRARIKSSSNVVAGENNDEAE